MEIKEEEVPFKKPILIGKIGRLPKKVTLDKASVVNKPEENSSQDPPKSEEPIEPPKLVNSSDPPQKSTENVVAYKEPQWSGLPQSKGRGYIFEVLKNGSIIETIDLMTKPFWLFGRLTNCDICMQHPTISRHHAILQYRSEMGESEECTGFYIYDLGSTHGTFLNKNRLKQRTYTRMQVGHMLKLGCSTRTYILNGPDDDVEEESEFTVTELKQQRQAELLRREEEAKEALLTKQKLAEELKRIEEERGVDWGLGEDADEEPDLNENPYAQTNNEELYLDDPKKALRGFFEREGLDLEYDCSEQGMGQFLCKVELPLDDEMGKPIFAEVIHKGKKKEAVVQCALEACRVLDRFGVLRQATHESRKRKPKNWEENDFYDSDDDTFLDRTGTIEKKREMRMKVKMPRKAETYESLLERHKSITENIQRIESELFEAQSKFTDKKDESPEEDSLDTFMKDLKDLKPDKRTINRLKGELIKLKQEQSQVANLVKIAKPVSLPDLVPPEPSTSTQTKPKALPMFGKRKKIKLQLPVKPATTEPSTSNMDVEEEDEDSEKEETERIVDNNQEESKNVENREEEEEDIAQDEIRMEEEESAVEPQNSSETQEDSSKPAKLLTLVQFEKILEKQKLPNFSGKHREKLHRILHKLKKLASAGDRMDVDWKILEAKKRKIMKLISDLNESEQSEPNYKLEFKVSSELSRILNELNVMTDQKFKVISKVKKMGDELKSMSEEIGSDLKNRLEEEESKEGVSSSNNSNLPSNSKSDGKSGKRKERQRQKQQDRVEKERQRGYIEDASREDYNMWVPPSDQSGDGKTSLNEKYGY